MNFKTYWDNSYKTYNPDKDYSNWLKDYLKEIKSCETEVLDLGCGAGSDANFLTQLGVNVVACDFSFQALKRIENKNIKTMLVDMTQKLPFDNDKFGFIIADLSLHYFDEKTTFEIMKEIKRILKPNGVLLARVNSVEDIIHGAGQGEKIEDNFYYVKGYNKRFFNFEDVYKFFSVIGKVEAKKVMVSRFTKPKPIIEVKVTK